MRYCSVSESGLAVKEASNCCAVQLLRCRRRCAASLLTGLTIPPTTDGTLSVGELSEECLGIPARVLFVSLKCRKLTRTHEVILLMRLLGRGNHRGRSRGNHLGKRASAQPPAALEVRRACHQSSELAASRDKAPAEVVLLVSAHRTARKLELRIAGGLMLAGTSARRRPQSAV